MSPECSVCEVTTSEAARFCPRCGRALPANTSVVDERVSEESVTMTAYQYDSEPSIASLTTEELPSMQLHEVAAAPSCGGCQICGAVTEGESALCEQCRKLTVDKAAERD